MHKHVTTCEHEIKVCDCCDSAYCTKCEKEWGTTKPCNLNHWPTYIPYPVYPNPPAVFPSWKPYWGISAGGTNVGGLFGNSMLQLNSTGSNQQ